jgi:hypothetical protein
MGHPFREVAAGRDGIPPSPVPHPFACLAILLPGGPAGSKPKGPSFFPHIFSPRPSQVKGGGVPPRPYRVGRCSRPRGPCGLPLRARGGQYRIESLRAQRSNLPLRSCLAPVFPSLPPGWSRTCHGEERKRRSRRRWVSLRSTQPTGVPNDAAWCFFLTLAISRHCEEHPRRDATKQPSFQFPGWPRQLVVWVPQAQKISRQPSSPIPPSASSLPSRRLSRPLRLRRRHPPPARKGRASPPPLSTPFMTAFP